MDCHFCMYASMEIVFLVASFLSVLFGGRMGENHPWEINHVFQIIIPAASDKILQGKFYLSPISIYFF